MLIMNIININLRTIQTEIEEYKKNNEQIYIRKKGSITTKYITPVLLMSYDTFKLLKNYNNLLLIEKEPFIWTIYGCYICIANWLPLGEVDIR